MTPDVPAPWQAMADLADLTVERIDALRRLVAIVPGDVGRRTQLRQALLARAVTIASDDRDEARSRFREAATAQSERCAHLAGARQPGGFAHEDRLQSLARAVRVAPHHEEGRAALRKALIDDARALSAAGRGRRGPGTLARSHRRDRRRRRDLARSRGDDAKTRTKRRARSNRPRRSTATTHASPRRIEWLHGPQVDPSVLPAPGDAFARFEEAACRPRRQRADVDWTTRCSTRSPHCRKWQRRRGRRSGSDCRCRGGERRTALESPRRKSVQPADRRPPRRRPTRDVAAAADSTRRRLAVDANAADAHTVMIVDDSPTIRKILAPHARARRLQRRRRA